jgi:hypothetical protein
MDDFFDDFTEFVEHSAFVIAMAAAVDKARRCTDVTLVFFRPFHDLEIAVRALDTWESFIAVLTALI